MKQIQLGSLAIEHGSGLLNGYSAQFPGIKYGLDSSDAGHSDEEFEDEFMRNVQNKDAQNSTLSLLKSIESNSQPILNGLSPQEWLIGSRSSYI